MALLKTSIEDLEGLFKLLGVNQGDVVMIHSSVFTLGRIENGLAGMYQALKNVIGKNGTLIVPTFTYSFRRNKPFDICNSPTGSEIGAFAEYLRKHEESIRSADPLFSMSAIGPQAKQLMQRNSKECFGPTSIFEKIFQANALFLALGITYSSGIACFMHLEHLADVDYRIPLRLDGISIDEQGAPYEDYAMHFARNEAQFPYACFDREPMGQKLEEAGISKAIEYGSGRHMGLRAKPFAHFVLETLKEKPHFMLKKELQKRNFS